MDNVERQPIIMIGAGGHATALMDILIEQGREVVAFVSPDKPVSPLFETIRHLDCDAKVLSYSAKGVRLVNGIGQLPNSRVRLRVSQYFLARGYHFETVIADSALVSKHSVIADGVQIFPGAIVNTGSKVESMSIVNSRAIVEHDCLVGSNNHIAPGAILCGQVKTGDNVFVGAGATVIQNIEIASGSTIGAGAVVTRNLEQGQMCLPCKSLYISN